MQSHRNPLISIEDELTHEHREIIRLLANGARNNEIARVLNLTVSQVRTRMHHLMIIFDAHDRAHVVAQAARAGVLDLSRVQTVDERAQELSA